MQDECDRFVRCVQKIIFLRHFPKTYFLYVPAQLVQRARNEIGRLPDDLGGMHALRSLCAHSNTLEDLPTSVGGLVSLELCDLSGNRYFISCHTLVPGICYAVAADG